MTWEVAIAALALLVALAGWMRVRRLSRKLEQLTQSYWELRYQYGQLRADVAARGPTTATEAGSTGGPPGEAFIPLSSLKRS